MRSATVSKQITLNYCGMDGQGRTVSEAKKDAARKLESAVTGSYEPILLSCRKYAVLVYRHQAGWDCFADELSAKLTNFCLAIV